MKTEILRLDNVSLQMSGIMQLERFNLQIFSGEIMGLMALNAHGVSSLVSLLQSNTPVHFGRVYYCEQLVNSHIYSRTTPNEIVVIEQKSHLVNGLTVGDNVFVLSGVERRWLLHTQSFRGRLQELEQAVGVDIPCNRQVEELSLFERCMVNCSRPGNPERGLSCCGILVIFWRARISDGCTMRSAILHLVGWPLSTSQTATKNFAGFANA